MDQQAAQTSQFCQVFGGGTGGVDMGTPTEENVPPFAVVDGKITNWVCMCGFTLLKSDEEVSVEPSSTAWLEITHPSVSAGFSMQVVCSSAAPSNSTSKTYVRLYDFDEDGLVRRDYRGMIILPFLN